MRVALTELRRVARTALLHYGYNDEESETILDVLLYAQLRGNNQGIAKLIGRGMPKDPAAGQISIEKETKLSALINGNKNPGMVVLKKATQIALDKAQEHGFGIAGTFNTHTSTGAIGYYARKLAERGFIGFVFAGSPASVCTYGSYERVFGTNPIAVGLPSETDPVVLDMATAAMAWYGLVEAKAAGKPIPDHTAYDSQGHLTTDPAEAMEGAVLPFDRSYKGAGLSMIIEMLTGPLVTASFVGIGDARGNWGNLVFAIDPELLTDGQAFKKNVSKLVERVQSTKKLPGVKEILVPGERGDKLTRQRLGVGEMEIEDNLYMELKKVIGEK